MNKKEERLSPRAGKLLEGARTKYASNPQKALEYLESINPSELNLYDRQKIGREIVARYKSQNSNYNTESIRSSYGLLTKKDNSRVEEEKEVGKYENLFRSKMESLKYADEKRKLADERLGKCETGKSKNIGRMYLEVGNIYMSAKDYSQAIECFSAAMGLGLTEDEDHYSVKDYYIERAKKQQDLVLQKKGFGKKSSSGLEKAVATTAVVGLIGGSFFLSSNVTGNVIGLSNTTSSWIGGVLILIGLIALGFWVRNKMNRKKVVVQKVSKQIKKKKK